MVIDDEGYRFPVLRKNLRPEDMLERLRGSTWADRVLWLGQIAMDRCYADPGTPRMRAFVQGLMAHGAELWEIGKAL